MSKTDNTQTESVKIANSPDTRGRMSSPGKVERLKATGNGKNVSISYVRKRSVCICTQGFTVKCFSFISR